MKDDNRNIIKTYTNQEEIENKLIGYNRQYY